MASRPLRRVPGIQSELLLRLQKANLHTCKDVLSRTELELLQLLNLSIFSIRNLLHDVSNAVAPTSRTMWSVHAKLPAAALDMDSLLELDLQALEPNHLRTSLSSLDELLRVGLPAGTITEIVGPSSVGKSQFCHMLSAIATLPKHLGGLDAGVIILDTESSFSAERLVEIARSRFPFHFNNNVEDFIQLTSRVHVYTHIDTSEALLQKLQTLQTEIIEKKVKLLIIDSIAALVRKEFDGASIVQRQNLLMREATLLKYLAENFQIPVIVTNQVTSAGSSKTSYTFANRQSGKGQKKGVFVNNSVTAALGTVWAHCVNTRLVLEYSNESDATAAVDSGVGSQRQIVIAKSPVAPVSTLPYVITSAGIELMTGPDGQEIVNVNSNNYWNSTIQSRPTTTPGGISEAQHTMVAEQQHSDTTVGMDHYLLTA